MIKKIKKKGSKYKNKIIFYEGIKFDSKAELNYYMLLLSICKKEDIILQPEFELLGKFSKNQKNYRATIYKADFQVGNNVYDIKGFTTQVFAIKRKLFDAKFPDLNLILLKEAPKWYGEPWIEVDTYTKLMAKRKREANKLAKQAK